MYKCTHHECNWADYKKGLDWDFYTENGRNISGCRSCMEQCQANPQCQSIECGNDQPLLDGTVIPAYCSWWRKGACQTSDEFSLNGLNFIWTCTKKGNLIKQKLKISNFIVLDMK